MRATMIAVVLLAVGAARAEAGGPTLEMKDCTVHQVEAEGNKVVFTVSGRCALLVPDPDREKGRMKWWIRPWSGASSPPSMARCTGRKPGRTTSREPRPSPARPLGENAAWSHRGGATPQNDGGIAAVRCPSALLGPPRHKP